jgi:hypothetical protein
MGKSRRVAAVALRATYERSDLGVLVRGKYIAKLRERSKRARRAG